MTLRPRRSAALGCAAALIASLAVSGSATAAGAEDGRSDKGQSADRGRPKGDRQVLQRYAEDTWASFVAMVDPVTGLPADNVDGDLDAGSRSGYTSPTNIGAYLWSTVVARDLGIVDRREARQRMARTLDTVADLERHDDSGMFYNWYSESTGEKLTVWPVDGGTVYPFLSSVDNAWLATALVLVGNAEPRLRDEAEVIRRDMDFGFYYDDTAADGNPAARQLRGGFWDDGPPAGNTTTVKFNYRDRGPDVWYTGHHYGTLNTEPRMASYLGIAWDQIPPEHYFSLYRTFPDACDWSWPEQRPVGVTREYLGVEVFEGAYRYRGMQLVPTWGGSMFEALMVDLFVPEADWGRRSWGVNHPLTVRAHIEHGMEEAGYGYWGFSPSSDPAGGYREYGVDPIGMEPNGYTSDQERTTADPGWDADCPPRPASWPAEYGDGVVTPHASFLALPYAKRAALANLAKMADELGAYGPGGFYDAVAVRSGQVAERYLSLDQGMVMAAIGNELRDDSVKRYVVRGAVQREIRPLLRMETFSARP